jgi:hypothetical protein
MSTTSNVFKNVLQWIESEEAETFSRDTYRESLGKLFVQVEEGYGKLLLYAGQSLRHSHILLL